MSSEIRKRKSIYQLQDDYKASKDSNNELVLLVKAFTELQEKPFEDLQKELLEKMPKTPSSLDFYGRLAGVHGLSFVEGSPQYCEHRTVLFPTWHRIYLYTLEEALRGVPGCGSVTLPYWDVSNSNLDSVPWVFTQPEIDLKDGNSPIKNPLSSYTFPMELSGDPSETKPKGYETVRYPLSGLQGTQKAKDFSSKHNEYYKGKPEEQAKELNRNIDLWLGGDAGTPYGVREKYTKCLKENSYYYFSHRTPTVPTSRFIVPLESPHDSMHLAIGGFAPDFILENQKKMDEVSKVSVSMMADKKTRTYQTQKHSFGDMQFVPLAAFDPIFWFHHCFVDFMFWKWQKAHDQTKFKDLNIKADEGPKRENHERKAHEDIKRPLKPFLKKDGGFYYSADCIDIINDLKYDYEEAASPKLMPLLQPNGLKEKKKVPLIVVQNIDRTGVKGPFVVQVRHVKSKQIVWEEAVFNRINMKNCTTCQENPAFGFSFPLNGIDLENKDLKEQFEISLAGQAQEMNETSTQPQAALDLNAPFDETTTYEEMIRKLVGKVEISLGGSVDQ